MTQESPATSWPEFDQQRTVSPEMLDKQEWVAMLELFQGIETRINKTFANHTSPALLPSPPSSSTPDSSELSSFIQVSSQVTARATVRVTAQVGIVRSYCEICILVMQMKERGQPHLCEGLNDNYYITCVEVLESLLRADKALVYWLKNGCMHMDSTGPEIVQPCPALNICSWVPNLFATPPSLVRNGVESLCPKDNKFLPTIPEEYKKALEPG